MHFRFCQPGLFYQTTGRAVNAGEGLNCVILEAEPISDFGSTAAERLENLDTDLEQCGFKCWIAPANKLLRELLQVTGLTKRFGKDNKYVSVPAALLAQHDCFDKT